MKWAVLSSVLATFSATAQPLRDGDVTPVRSRYDYGQFPEVETAAQTLLDQGGLTASQLVEVHLYAGLAAFHLQAHALSERHFTALLRTDPDYTLDPFLAPPPALRAFETLRAKLQPELQRLRARRDTTAQTSAQAERSRTEENARAQARGAQLEAMARQATVRRAGSRSLWIDFVPFGAGQFQQGRTGAGIAFAVSEIALALTSLISLLVYNGLWETRSLTVNNQSLGGNGEVQLFGIPRGRQGSAEILRWLNLGSAIGFYGVYGGGVVEALVRHPRDEDKPTVSVGAAGAGVQLSLSF